MKLSLIYAGAAGFLLSSFFEDAIRSTCEGRVPFEWLVFFAGGFIVCLIVAFKLQKAER